MNEIRYEIRYIDSNTIILWVSQGQNIFLYRDGAWNNKDVFQEVKSFERGESKFTTIKELHSYAFKELGYAK